MAGKKGSMADFLAVDKAAGWGPGNAVWEKLNARETGRNPPKSMSGSTSVPAPKVKAAAPKVSVPAVKGKMLSSPTKQPELSKVLSRPLEANRSSRMTMASAANRRLQNVRSNRGK
jgi:hypothetical protein